MHPLVIAAPVLVAAAFADEFTTQMCIKNGDIEANKVLDFFYRGDRPTALQGYGIGGALEAVELTFYSLMTRFVPAVSPWVWVTLCAAESAVHIACAISNYRLAKTGKAIFVL